MLLEADEALDLGRNTGADPGSEWLDRVDDPLRPPLTLRRDRTRQFESEPYTSYRSQNMAWVRPMLKGSRGTIRLYQIL